MQMIPLTSILRRTSLFAFVVALHLCGCATGKSSSGTDSNSHTATSSSESVRVHNLRLDAGEVDISQSLEFAYFSAGHFGDKTQYNGKVADEFGGAVAVHCRGGKPFSIEIKYPGKGIDRSSAIKVMQRLLPPDAGKVIEHDDEDRSKMDTHQPAEFFYYSGGPRTELLFANDSNTNVVQVNVWTKNG